jgi:trans-2,3-dihydro-3-hydroxyanthranilate isomerase
MDWRMGPAILHVNEGETPMAERRYLIYDVFTDTRLEGNPLAIVMDGGGLGDDRMQAIAAEFNLSETVFVQPAGNQVHTAAVRIFTPKFELPFAGHPTVGTAIALAEDRGRVEGGDGAILVLEEKIGDVRCVVSRHGRASALPSWRSPRSSSVSELHPVQYMFAIQLVTFRHTYSGPLYVAALPMATKILSK